MLSSLHGPLSFKLCWFWSNNVSNMPWTDWTSSILKAFTEFRRIVVLNFPPRILILFISLKNILISMKLSIEILRILKELKRTSWPLPEPPFTRQRNRKYKALLLITSFYLLSFPKILLMIFNQFFWKPFLSISPHTQLLSVSLANNLQRILFCFLSILALLWKFCCCF